MDEGCHALGPIEMATLHKNVADSFASDHKGFCGAKMIYSPYRADMGNIFANSL